MELQNVQFRWKNLGLLPAWRGILDHRMLHRYSKIGLLLAHGHTIDMSFSEDNILLCTQFKKSRIHLFDFDPFILATLLLSFGAEPTAILLTARTDCDLYSDDQMSQLDMYSQQVRTLKFLTCMTIRKCLKPPILTTCKHLPLPKQLLDHLSLNFPDLCHPQCLQHVFGFHHHQYSK